ncbi:hypothetical protein [Streptomyces sp. NPDC088246]|uniref:hypothetical protein n=1 Tax=Streptomyces sp. NPDC088246 TaxID=3365842 RepID=UPI003816C22D
MAEVPGLTYMIRTLGDLVSGNDKLLRAARDMLPNPENSIEAIASLLGASVGTPYNHYRLPTRLAVPVMLAASERHQLKKMAYGQDPAPRSAAGHDRAARGPKGARRHCHVD